MALRFCDSFDHYLASSPTQAFLRKWTATRNGTPTAFITGRFGSGWSGAERWSYKQFSDSQQTWTVGGAWSFGNGNGYDTSAEAIYGLWDSGTLHMDLRVNGSYIYATRNGTQVGGGAAFIPIFKQWYFIEFKVKIDDTTGTVECRIDGTTVFNYTGQDTRNAGNASANRIRIGSSADVQTNRTLDDFYITDSTGSVNTGFLGDVRVEAIMPNGNGNTNNMVGSDGNSTDNYLLVDEPTTIDDDTTYTQSGTVGDKDLYAYEAVTPSSGSVVGVQILPCVKKTDAGTRSIVTVARESATEADGPVQTLGTTYVYMPDIRETKPSGGAWSISDVNGAEFGWKVNA